MINQYNIKPQIGLTLCFADKFGRHKTDDEVDELELLRRENFRIKHQVEEKDMVVELLKK